jgi:transposase-like protein
VRPHNGGGASGDQHSLIQLAERYDINPQMVHKWRKRSFVADARMGPKSRSTTLSEEEEAIWPSSSTLQLRQTPQNSRQPHLLISSSVPAGKRNPTALKSIHTASPGTEQLRRSDECRQAVRIRPLFVWPYFGLLGFAS